jgi:hypothetical protein
MIVCYTKTDAGATMSCPSCSQTIVLAGELAPVATIQEIRRHSLPQVLIVIGSFALMTWFPIGTLLGIAFVIYAWKKSTTFVCGNCQKPLKDKQQPSCSACRATFTRD